MVARTLALSGLALALLTGTTHAAAPDAGAGVSELVREAEAHVAQHEDDLALRRYTEALALDPTRAEAYAGLGELRARRGDLREAERIYTMAMERVLWSKDFWIRRARVRWQLGHHADGEQDLEMYVTQTKDIAALRELAGWYGEDGRVPAQLATWRRVLSIAIESGDLALAKEARTLVRALQILVGPADPVVAPPWGPREGVRQALAGFARRAI
jgi:tetratricopeptide (TPR) repeat protein